MPSTGPVGVERPASGKELPQTSTCVARRGGASRRGPLHPAILTHRSREVTLEHAAPSH